MFRFTKMKKRLVSSVVVLTILANLFLTTSGAVGTTYTTSIPSKYRATFYLNGTNFYYMIGVREYGATIRLYNYNSSYPIEILASYEWVTAQSLTVYPLVQKSLNYTMSYNNYSTYNSSGNSVKQNKSFEFIGTYYYLTNPKKITAGNSTYIKA